MATKRKAKASPAPLRELILALRTAADALEHHATLRSPEPLAQQPAIQEHLHAALALLAQAMPESLPECAEALQGKETRPLEEGVLVDFGLSMDREANQALHAWGRLPMADFVSSWKSLDPEIVQRTATAVGLPVAKRLTKLFREELHRRAVRFVRNTAV